ncbi:MAG: tetratricopeptide repeat protein [Bacteroidota bacterium]|nr:tetratricopeptide repeat protein [Bacteroidota bacterium]
MINYIKIIFTLIIAAICLFYAGCGSSEEIEKESTSPQPGATEAMQKELSDLKIEHEALKKQVVQVEQEKRNATARAAELETQIAELKEKISTPRLPAKPAITDARESYKSALRLFHDRKYSEASTTFQSLLESDIPIELQDNCYYWLGECNFGLKNYVEAIKQFEKVFSFKISEKKDESQVMIANSYLAMGNKVKAKEEYEVLLKKFPASPYVKKVKEKLPKL